MKKKLLLLTAVFALICLTLCAFEFDNNASLKNLTQPYINTYECTSARLGNEDLLNKFEYFKITFLDKEQLEISYKRKNGKRHAYKCDYEFDEKTHELTAEFGILGFKYKQKSIIEDGKFTISMPILAKQLVMNFEVK